MGTNSHNDAKDFKDVAKKPELFLLGLMNNELVVVQWDYSIVCITIKEWNPYSGGTDCENVRIQRNSKIVLFGQRKKQNKKHI